MMDIVGLTLVLTRRCNVTCRHCGFASGPAAVETMDVGEAQEYLWEARRFPSLQMVSLTGGEPFLYYENVIEIISFAASLGLQSEIVTNSSWAASYDLARQLLGDLQRCGLVHFVTSHDRFHLEFIDAGHIRNAVRAALDLGLQVTVKTLNDEPAAAMALELPENAANLKVSAAHVVPEGRAYRWRGTALPGSDLESFEGRCDKIIRFPAIRADGTVYPCCSFGEQARMVGTAREAPLYDLLLQMQHNLLFNMIGHAGPLRIWKMACESIPGYLPATYHSACEICNALYQDEQLRDALHDLLIKLAAEKPKRHSLRTPSAL